MDLTTKDGVRELMGGCRSEEQWNEGCVRVKAANGGLYPDFWFAEIIQSGLIDEVRTRWGDRGPLMSITPITDTTDLKSLFGPPRLRCFRCGREPGEIQEYLDLAEAMGFATAAEAVREQEGTLNRETNEFACTDCYIAIGQPSNPYPGPRWTP